MNPSLERIYKKVIGREKKTLLPTQVPKNPKEQTTPTTYSQKDKAIVLLPLSAP
jgi:hypothetical protein